MPVSIMYTSKYIRLTRSTEAMHANLLLVYAANRIFVHAHAFLLCSHSPIQRTHFETSPCGNNIFLLTFIVFYHIIPLLSTLSPPFSAQRPIFFKNSKAVLAPTPKEQPPQNSRQLLFINRNQKHVRANSPHMHLPPIPKRRSFL